MSQHEEHKSHKFSVPNRCYVNGAASCNTVHVTGWSVGRTLTNLADDGLFNKVKHVKVKMVKLYLKRLYLT